MEVSNFLSDSQDLFHVQLICLSQRSSIATTRFSSCDMDKRFISYNELVVTKNGHQINYLTTQQ